MPGSSTFTIYPYMDAPIPFWHGSLKTNQSVPMAAIICAWIKHWLVSCMAPSIIFHGDSLRCRILQRKPPQGQSNLLTPLCLLRCLVSLPNKPSPCLGWKKPTQIIYMPMYNCIYMYICDWLIVCLVLWSSGPQMHGLIGALYQSIQ